MKAVVYAIGSIVWAILAQWFLMMLVVLSGFTVEYLSGISIFESSLATVVGFLIIVLPPLLVPMALIGTGRVYRPWVTLPFGTLALFLPWLITKAVVSSWLAVSVVALAGMMLSWFGCYLAIRIPGRRSRRVVESPDGQADCATTPRKGRSQSGRSRILKLLLGAPLSIMAAMAIHFFLMALGCLVLSPSHPDGIPTGGVLGFSILYLPPFLTAAILVHVKPFYRPWITAPLGSILLFAAIALSYDTASSREILWVPIAFVALLGAMSLVGCYVGSRIPLRQRTRVAARLSRVG